MEGLKKKFNKFFNIKDSELENNNKFIVYKDRLEHELEIIVKMDSDDIMVENRIKTQHEYMKQHFILT